MDQLAARTCALNVWAGGNSTENYILKAGTGCREKGELVPSLPPSVSDLLCPWARHLSSPSTLTLLQAARSAGQGLLLTM